MKTIAAEKHFTVKNIAPFSLQLTLECGQAFRFKNEGSIWHGIAMGRYLELEQQGDTLIFYNTTQEAFETVWKHYFDLERDYGEIACRMEQNPILKEISLNCGGIHILNQDPWEALCSFIISQNNNIPRITGIVERFCEGFGRLIQGGYAFPKPEDIANLTPEELSPIRAGFRAKYIIDAAKKCTDGTIHLESLKQLSTDAAREQLMQIKGVGPKVADCALLFGLGHKEAFPMDVWMKRAMSVLFQGKLPPEAEPCAGIVQQYIFHYARTTKLGI